MDPDDFTVSTLQAGKRVSLTWEDRGTLRTSVVRVLDVQRGMLHFIDGKRPQTVDLDDVWDWEDGDGLV